MLIRLMPDQIARWWTHIKFSIEQTMYDECFRSYEYLNNLLLQLLLGEMQAWFWIREPESLLAVIVTSLYKDVMTQGNCLRVVSAYGFAGIEKEEMLEAISTLEKFARLNKCMTIEGITSNIVLLKAAKASGWKSQNLVWKEV